MTKIPENTSLAFKLDPHVIKSIVESQKVFARLAESARPIISSYLEQQHVLERIVRQVNYAPSARWAAMDISRTFASIASSAEQISRIQQSVEPFRGLGSVYAQISESMRALMAAAATCRFDALIQAYSASFQIQNYAHMATTTRATVLRISEAFRPTVDAFFAVREAARRKSELTASFQIVAREHFLTTDLMRVMTAVGRKRFRFEDERNEAIIETDAHILLTLPEALSKLDPRLCRLWQGAWESLKSKNSDRIRHTLVSAQELVTQALHVLSPNDQVAAWSKAKEHWPNGRPTRKARLLFIYSSVNSPVIENYLRRDIEACDELCNLLNKGTHGVAIEFSDTQMKVILRRVHSMICALVEVKKAAG